MAVWPNDYMEKVVQDVEKYNGVRKVIKAGLLERCAVKYCSPEILHPNPDDEFSQPDIGPNMGIVSKYVQQINYNTDSTIFEEPLIVQKMEPDGYLLLNGHHRWFAAVRMRVKKIHIKIVNMITENELNQMINKTNNQMLASFDLDEVLLARDVDKQEPLKDGLFSKKIKERLRKGAPAVIKAFQEKGYDVCVYTSGYMTEEDFDNFFYMYGIKVDVVVNGVNSKRNNTTGSSKNLKEMLRDKYKLIVHVDNESLICTNRVTKDYDMYDIKDSKDAWAEGIIALQDTIQEN